MDRIIHQKIAVHEGPSFTKSRSIFGNSLKHARILFLGVSRLNPLVIYFFENNVVMVMLAMTVSLPRTKIHAALPELDSFLICQSVFPVALSCFAIIDDETFKNDLKKLFNKFLLLWVLRCI